MRNAKQGFSLVLLHIYNTNVLIMQTKLNLKKLPYVWQILLKISISHYEPFLHKYSIFTEVEGTAFVSNAILLALFKFQQQPSLEKRLFIKAIRSIPVLAIQYCLNFVLPHIFSREV